MESRAQPQPPGAEAKVRWTDRLRRNPQIVSAFAVVTVGVAGLAAALMSPTELQDQAPPQVAAKVPKEVVRAPQQVVKAPPLQTPAGRAEPARRSPAEASVDSGALGAGPPCRDCGVVESVVMLERKHGYQMRIRMDDGSLRTVAQRGALPAGSRVVVERGRVRIMPGATGQG